MFVQACTPRRSSDLRKVVEAGLACILARSEYGLLIRDLLDVHATSRRLAQGLAVGQDKWDNHDPRPDGFNAPFNIDAKLNGAYIAFGLLGGGDFEKTGNLDPLRPGLDCNRSAAGAGRDPVRSDPREIQGRVAKLKTRNSTSPTTPSTTS
jgi:hypothetical protein